MKIRLHYPLDLEAVEHLRHSASDIWEPDSDYHWFPEAQVPARLHSQTARTLFAGILSGEEDDKAIVTTSDIFRLVVSNMIRNGQLKPDQVELVTYLLDDEDPMLSMRHLRLGNDGDLLDPWPGGFFDDSLALVLGILED